MNNDFQKEKTKFYKNYIVKIIAFIVLLLICGLGTYLITERLTDPKYQKSNLETENDKSVYNNSKAFDDDITIVLKNDGTVSKTQSLKDFKKDNDISSDVTEQFIVNYFESEGYKLDEYADSKIVFSKDTITTSLVPNKYYLGEKDGYFAIYKTDSNGKPTIEESSDVYSNSKQIKSLPLGDQEEIKSFKHYYDTKEEAQERLSGYIS